MSPRLVVPLLLLALLGCDEPASPPPERHWPRPVSLPPAPAEAVPIAGGLFNVRVAGVTRVDETCEGGAPATNLTVEGGGSTTSLEVRTLPSVLDASPPSHVTLGEAGASVLLARPDGARATVLVYGGDRAFREAVASQAIFAPGDAPMLALGAWPFPPERRPDERHPEPGDPPRSVVLGAVEVEGGQTVLGVSAVATRVLDQLECCWHRALLTRNVRAGEASVVASIAMDASGATTSVMVSGGDDWSGLSDCLESVLVRFSCPVANSASHAQVTLDFSTAAD